MSRTNPFAAPDRDLFDAVVPADDADSGLSAGEGAAEAPEAQEEASDVDPADPADEAIAPRGAAFYDGLTVDVLRAELKARELTTTGVKSDLVARLVEDDSQ